MSEKRKAIGVHNTDVTEGEWDGPKAVASMPNEAETLRYCHAWLDPNGDPEAKNSYKFPHHRTLGGPAVLPGVRNALARLPQANIPEADRAGVERHLRAHLEKGQEESREVRCVAAVELRAEQEEDGRPKISGYAAVFNSPSEDLGGFIEYIRPGAFRKTLKEGDQRALWNHDSNLVLGRRKAGTLALKEDEVGLQFTIYPPDTQAGRDALESIRRGDVDQMSFAFQVIREDWKQEGEEIMRGLNEVRLFEISPVTFPAYPQTSAFVRSKLNEFRRGITEEEPAAPVTEGQEPGEDDHPDGAEGQNEAQARRQAALRKVKFDILKRLMEE
jgi:hypothetical protein